MSRVELALQRRHSSGICSGYGGNQFAVRFSVSRIPLITDEAPRAGIVKQGGEERVVHAVAGAQTADMADDRRASEVKVADKVERLVARALVVIAQPVLVEGARRRP